MKTEAAGSNGIGPLVRQYVHERNAARKAGEAAAITAPTPAVAPSVDTVELSASALARFEAWKAKHSTPAPEVTDPVPDPVTGGTDPLGTELPGTEPTVTDPPATEPPPATDPIATDLEPVIPPGTPIVDPEQDLISQLTTTIDDAASISILV
jgi:hypothetical protein